MHVEMNDDRTRYLNQVMLILFNFIWAITSTQALHLFKNNIRRGGLKPFPYFCSLKTNESVHLTRTHTVCFV